MKKSVYKVTGWSLIIAFAVIYGLHKNNMPKYPVQTLSTNVNYKDDDNSSEAEQNFDNGIDYNNSYASKSPEEVNIDNNVIINSSSQGSQPNSNQDFAMASDMGILENKSTNSPEFNETENINKNNDVAAKGGPNNSNVYNESQQINSTLSTNASNALPTSSSASGSSSTINSARASAPTIVTAPPNPSGGTSGGSGAGDPFVPIDDYYGLIFLVVASTLIGVFTIKKSKII